MWYTDTHTLLVLSSDRLWKQQHLGNKKSLELNTKNLKKTLRTRQKDLEASLNGSYWPLWPQLEYQN